MKKRFLSFSLAILMIVCTVVGTLPSVRVNAAGGEVKIAAEVNGEVFSGKLIIGDVVTVKVILPKITDTRKFQIDLNYNNSVLKYNEDADATPVISVLTIGAVKPVENNKVRLVATGMNNVSFDAGTVALTASFTVMATGATDEVDVFSLGNFICGDAGVSADATPFKAIVKAKDDPVINVSSATVEQGGTVNVTLDLERNQGLAGMILSVEYDPALTVTNVVKGAALSKLTFAGGAKPYVSPLTLSWDGLLDDTSTGNLVTITFSVANDAKVGNYPIKVTYKYGDVFDENFNDMNPVINNGTIKVTELHVCSFGQWTKYDDEYHVHSCSCGKTEKAAHNWNSGVVTVQPGCTDKGEKTYTCTDCGATKTEEVASLGHSYDSWKVTTAATCTAGGAERRDCVNCDHYETRNTDALGHDIVKHSAKAATCTEIGWDAYETCSRCDYTTYEEIKALGHSYDSWKVTTAATCTVGGAERRDCVNCDHYETRNTDALGHDIVKHNAKAATCTEIGWKAYDTCSRCDYTTYEEIKALGHSYDSWKVTTAATCTKGGAERRDCVNCDHYETRNTDALGHDIVKHNAKAPTCTEIGWDAYETCSRCDYTTYEEIKALGHSYDSWKVTTAATCTAGGAERRDCVNCDHYETRNTDALGHDIVKHNAKAATCTEIGWDAYETCSRCDYTTYVEIPALGHSYDSWKVTTAATCTVGGAERRDCVNCDHYETRIIEALGHDLVHHAAKEPTYEENGWKAYDTCSRCDYTTYEEIPAKVHSYESVATPSTCTERGYTKHTCTICGNSYVDSYTEPNGHSFEEWYVTISATCTTRGEERRDCTICDHYETRPVEKLGHDIVKHNAKAPTCTEIGWKAYETCSRCDYTTYEEIKALGHSYDSWKVTTAATCTVGGAERRDCANCDHYETRNTDALGHDIVKHSAKAATCTEIGWNAYDTCSRCDYTTYEEIEALGHSYKSVVTPPTTTSEGYTTHTCERCGDSYVDSYVDKLPDGKITYGDVNSDGVINGKDLTLIRRSITGGFELGAFIEAAADVNLDGVINGKDLTLIRRFITGGFGVELGK